MVVALGSNNVALERGMEDRVLGMFWLALFAVSEYVSPGGRIREGELGRGDTNYRTISCMQGGDMLVGSPIDYHPGIVEVASSCKLWAWIATEWVQEHVVKCS